MAGFSAVARAEAKATEVNVSVPTSLTHLTGGHIRLGAEACLTGIVLIEIAAIATASMAGFIATAYRR